MKRLIAAVSFAVIATPVLATPFEQTQLDRNLPQVIAVDASAESSFADDHNFIAPAQ